MEQRLSATARCVAQVKVGWAKAQHITPVKRCRALPTYAGGSAAESLLRQRVGNGEAAVAHPTYSVNAT